MARLTYSERKSMPRSDFAVPSKRKGGKGGYPIEDANHARDALARVSADGSPAEKREVREKVHEKFPGIGEKGGGEKGDTKRGRVPRGEHYATNHREPRSHEDFETLGNPGKSEY